MKRLPLVPTLIVALAVAAMIALGVWQLQRAGEKRQAITRFEANAGLPPVSFSSVLADDRLLFRRTSAFCLAPVAWRAEAGRSRTGQAGWRHIASCRTGAEGPGFLVDVGVSGSAEAPKGWKGGEVRGLIAPAPSHTSLIARLFRKVSPERPMIVADVPAPGLAPPARPSPGDIPNNHVAYAVQWFVFAALAAGIYALALRRRWVPGRPDEPNPPSP